MATFSDKMKAKKSSVGPFAKPVDKPVEDAKNNKQDAPQYGTINNASDALNKIINDCRSIEEAKAVAQEGLDADNKEESAEGEGDGSSA